MKDNKKCTKCKEDKVLEDFCVNNSVKSGRHSHCKVCMKAYRQAYRETEEGKAKEKAYASIYYMEHKI